MRYIVILLFLSFNLNAQFTLQPDSSFIVSYNQALKIKHKVENLKEQVDILIKIGGNQDLVIKKLQLKDTLHYLEIEEYKKMDSILREKAYNADKIMYNYKILLLTSEEQLKASEKERKLEKLWKNIYKYSIPVAVGLTGYLLLK